MSFLLLSFSFPSPCSTPCTTRCGQSGSEDSEYGEGVDSDSNDENNPDNEYVLVLRCGDDVWVWVKEVGGVLFGYSVGYSAL